MQRQNLSKNGKDYHGFYWALTGYEPGQGGFKPDQGSHSSMDLKSEFNVVHNPHDWDIQEFTGSLNRKSSFVEEDNSNSSKRNKISF